MTRRRLLHTGSLAAVAATAPGAAALPPNGTVSSLTPAELADFARNPPAVRRLLEQCLELTRRGLRYQMGSADPATGGLDCSGAVHFALTQAGVKDVPRQADEIYRWVWEAGLFRAVVGKTMATFELKPLAPGDLLFWTGTYPTPGRDPAVSHVMIHLGKTKSDARPVMFGASDGRPFRGQARNGVSVFDFRLPSEKSAARFIGYGAIPGVK